MPVKNSRGKKPALKKKMKKIPQIFSFSRSELFDNLTENEKKDLLANCSLLFCNPALKKVCDDIFTAEMLEAFSEKYDQEKYIESRGRIFGISNVYETIKSFHLEYLDSVKKQESFDRQEVI